jgi:Spy/CpxP family protein refolding chaperone
MEPIDDRERNSRFWQLDHWGAPIVGVLIILLALVGISASRAEPTSTPEGEVGEVCDGHDCNSRRHGRWGHHRRGHRFFGHRRHDSEAAREHMQYAAGWMLKRLDVEGDVKEQIQARLDIAFDELMPLMEAHKDARETWLETVLGTDEVDREALEAQRRTIMASADRATQILSNTIADVAEMLTPEQRAAIAERLRSHHY